MSEPTVVYVVRGYPPRTREQFEQARRDAEPFRKVGEAALEALRKARYV